MSTFRKASRQQVPLKIAIEGVSGAGKTYSAIKLMSGLCERIALVDTENGSGELYSDIADYDYIRLEPPFKPADAVRIIVEAVREGYDGLIIDSYTHYWKYILAFKETLDQQPRSNSFANWGKVKPMYDELKQAILQSPIHICCCLRSKAEYIQTQDGNGKSRIDKVGTAPITEPENEYEFTTVFTVERSHQAVASKDRTAMFDNAMPITLSEETGRKFRDWLGLGELIPNAQWRDVEKGNEAARVSEAEAERLQVGVDKPALAKSNAPTGQIPEGINAFGYIPKNWPLDESFSKQVTDSQVASNDILFKKRDLASLSMSERAIVCRVLAEAFQISPDARQSSATFTLINAFLKEASEDSLKLALQAAFKPAEQTEDVTEVVS